MKFEKTDAILCKTVDECKYIEKILHLNGQVWTSGSPYLSNHPSSMLEQPGYENGIVYYPCENLYSNTHYEGIDRYNVIPLEKVLFDRKKIKDII